MVNIKYFLLIGLFIGAVAFISPLSASDDFSMLEALDITPFSEDTVVTIDGINFNIPKGYGEDLTISRDKEVDVINGVNFITSTHYYMNEKGNLIGIDVYYDEQQVLDSDYLSPSHGEVKKTIDGHEGLFLEKDGSCSFTYFLDGKTVMVNADNEATISDIII